MKVFVWAQLCQSQLKLPCLDQVSCIRQMTANIMKSYYLFQEDIPVGDFQELSTLS